MSHNIKQHDKVVSTEKTWHGLETIVPEITLENSGLDWDVEKRPVYAGDVPIENWSAIVRSDINHPIHVFKNSYTPIQNSRIWEVLENSLNGLDYEIKATGSLGNCAKIFYSVAIKDKQDYVVNGDDFKSHINFVNSNDGSCAFRVYDSNTRIVCQNTFNWSQSKNNRGSVNLSVKHTKNSELHIQNLEEVLEQLFEKREEFYSTLEFLANKPLSLERSEKILAGWKHTTVANKKEGLSTRAYNQVVGINELFEGGIGNNGETFYDLFNGVTEYYTTGRGSGNNEKNKFGNAEFGTGASLKLDFFNQITQDDQYLLELEKNGEKLLNEYDEKSKNLELV